MIRKILRSTIATVAGLTAATLAIELGFHGVEVTPLRWVLPLPPQLFYGPDLDSGFAHRPHVSGVWVGENRAIVTTSNLGLRDRDRDPDRKVGSRILVIGNSFIEAIQVDWSQTAAAVAERTLQRALPGAEVLNLGLPGSRPAVQVARLQSRGLKVMPDLAILMFQIEEIESVLSYDDSEHTGYRPGADGELHMSYGFRQTRRFQLRMGAAGDMGFWLIDHSQAVRILNDRKNAGLLVDWRSAGPSQEFGTANCDADKLVGPWIAGPPTDQRLLVKAYLRDLSEISRAHKLSIVVATHGIDAECANPTGDRAQLVNTIRSRVEAAGLTYVDLDARVAAKIGHGAVKTLFGFGASRGYGHLNVEGNRVYGEIFAEIIAANLPPR